MQNLETVLTIFLPKCFPTIKFSDLQIISDDPLCLIKPDESYVDPPKILIWFTFDKQLQICCEHCFMEVRQLPVLC